MSGNWARRTNCRDCGDNFTELELVQNGGLSCSVKTDLQTLNDVLPTDSGNIPSKYLDMEHEHGDRTTKKRNVRISCFPTRAINAFER